MTVLRLSTEMSRLDSVSRTQDQQECQAGMLAHGHIMDVMVGGMMKEVPEENTGRLMGLVTPSAPGTFHRKRPFFLPEMES